LEKKIITKKYESPVPPEEDEERKIKEEWSMGMMVYCKK